MSWYIKEVGVHKEALVASIKKQMAHVAVVCDEVVARVESMFSGHTGEMLAKGDSAVMVFTHGHIDATPERPLQGSVDMKIDVSLVKLHTAESHAQAQADAAAADKGAQAQP